jgi:hypothetical protein
MQQISHLFNTTAFLVLRSSGKPIDWSGTVPEFRDYHRRMWAGEVELADKEVKIVYGTKNSELFQIGMQPPTCNPLKDAPHSGAGLFFASRTSKRHHGPPSDRIGDASSPAITIEPTTSGRYDNP